jgi:hypothetical protein
VGMVNDHEVRCFRHPRVSAEHEPETVEKAGR